MTTEMTTADVSAQVVAYTGVEAAQATAHINNAVRQFLRSCPWSFATITGSLADTAGAAATELPADFAELIDPPAFPADSGYRNVTICSARELVELAAVSDATGLPQYCAVEAKPFNGAAAQIGRAHV